MFGINKKTPEIKKKQSKPQFKAADVKKKPTSSTTNQSAVPDLICKVKHFFIF